MVTFRGHELEVSTGGNYAHGGRVIQLYDEEGPYMTASVCIPGIKLAKDETCIKDYSENEGILDALIEAGIVEKTGSVAYSGYICATIVRILED
jgi:hypothetical protein